MRALGAAAGAGLGLASLLFGAFVADPVGATMELSRQRLLRAGAREETFTAGDGTRLSTMVLGRAGEGRPVVLLHGLGASASYWADTAVALRAQGRFVVMPDAPGSGRSAAPATDAGYSVPARVQAVEALVFALGLGRDRGSMDLVGHSLGGWTAAAYAVAHPLPIRRLVLVDSAGLSNIPERERDAARARVNPSSREGGRALFGLLFHRPPAPLPSGIPMPGFVFDGFARNYSKANVSRTVSLLDEKDALVGRETQLPDGTVLIWGADETLFPLTGAREAAAKIPGARLLVVTGVGHDGPLEAPAVFADALARALK